MHAQAMEVCVLASSSAGNSVAVRADGRIVLVDAGLSGRAIERRLEEVGWSPADISAVLLSHEHRDHSRGAGVVARRYGVPVYGTEGTLGALASLWRGTENLRPFRTGQAFLIGAVECEPYSIPHDVADPAQFVIRANGASVGIATDLGRVTSLVVGKLMTTSLAIVEANHCADLLRWGEYPWSVKQRIGSHHGHLDNNQAAELVARLAKAGVGHVVCAHLSPQHNTVERVRSVVAAALADANVRPTLTVVAPQQGTGVIPVAPREVDR